MSTSAPAVFTKQFESEVKHAYQRMGSMMRGTVRTVTVNPGESTHFPLVGKGQVGSKSRHGLVPVMNLDYDRVECPIHDRYAGEWIDDLDQLKTNVGYREATVRAMAASFGRDTDDFIITAAATATTTKALVTSGIRAFMNSVIEAMETLFGKDVPADSMVTGVIGWRMWSWMLQHEQFASADYTGPDLRPFMQGGRALQGKTWMGVHWITHSGLPKATNTRTNFLYHRDAIGHAIQRDYGAQISWENRNAAWFVQGNMAMGAVKIDDDGIVKMTLDESAALPTS